MESKNVFEGAKPGQMFVTENGRLVIFLNDGTKSTQPSRGGVECWVLPYDKDYKGMNNEYGWALYNKDGTCYAPYGMAYYKCYNIISKYQEKISNEELDDLTIKELFPDNIYYQRNVVMSSQAKHEMLLFERGYRKCEEKK